MLLKKNEKKWLFPAIAAAAALVVLAAGWFLFQKEPAVEPVPDRPAAAVPDSRGAVSKKLAVTPEISYQDLEREGRLKQMMGARKQGMGIRESLDMIVTPDETIQVGGNRVSMREILKKSTLGKGEVFTQAIKDSGAVVAKKQARYGIYVVQPNDNIWNIHFNILRDYYEHKGISLSPKADEPGKKGMSSGVGKILKFSENMVMIYNLAENRVARDINLIEPLSKIVVYNMDEVFSLLSRINYQNIDRIQFDGKTIWIPGNK